MSQGLVRGRHGGQGAAQDGADAVDRDRAPAGVALPDCPWPAVACTQARRLQRPACGIGDFADGFHPDLPAAVSKNGEQVPSLTARVARASNPAGTTAMWVRDRLDGLWCDEDFAGWYPRDGRAALSPAQLATVCVLQFLLDLSDRQAAEAVRCRIDFKYALAIELDDPGFHRSVLADFRERLIEGDRADRLLDLSLVRLKEAGLVRARTTQRTDSTHVLAAVRDLRGRSRQGEEMPQAAGTRCSRAWETCVSGGTSRVAIPASTAAPS